MGYMIIVGIFTFIGMLVSGRLKSKFKKYSQIGISSGQSGAEVAKSMLSHYGISDVKIVDCLLYTSPSPRDRTRSRMPSSA